MFRKFIILLFLSSIGFFAVSCFHNEDSNKLFVNLDANATGVHFINEVSNKEGFNIFSYRNFYNGGGVAIGDINNDGLNDIFFTSNMSSNKLYLNKGNMQFEDISDIAGIEDADKWSTGVVMVDINNDGFLDIYVCNAGFRSSGNQKNTLYINNKDLTFTEKAEEYGLDDAGYSTHAAFFDFDRDGDLDLYMLNNSFIPVNTLNYNNKRDLRAKDWPVKDFLKGGGDKLYKNENGVFKDVSEEAGIYGSLIGFGLGVTIADFNNDDWLDIYVCNDFFERDYFYLNNQDGTFTEALEEHFPHISLSSMGADAADINNDGNIDLFVTDMLPRDELRLKTTATFENIDVYNLKQERGFYHQFMQNSLHLNSDDGKFTEIAYYSGVAASDWSWGALIFDADGDMNADLLVCNGIYHDVIDQDFIDFFANEVIQKMTLSGKKEEIEKITDEMPSVPIQNHFFKNKGNLEFVDNATQWGLVEKTFSNGAAYGDLNNDGFPDLVINNVNQPAMIYLNTNVDKNNFLQLQFKGSNKNTFAIGTKVSCYLDSTVLTQILMPSRGFQSSVDYKLNFGIGKNEVVDSILIVWPDGLLSKLHNVRASEKVVVDYQNIPKVNKITEIAEVNPLFSILKNDYFDTHVEDDFIDFYYARNLSQATSKEGPKIAIGDVNGDGMEDIYIGGAKGQPGQIYFQSTSGWSKSVQNDLEKDAEYEDTAVAFIDVDNDGDLDLYVGSGGNSEQVFSALLQDRLYINDGTGNFKRDIYALPRTGMNTSVVAPYDYDQDGDMDIFVGSRNIPFNYGISPPGFLLNNVGGKFKDVAKLMNPELAQPGMVTDAKWIDVVGGKHKELVIVGEWMSPKIFEYTGKVFQRRETNLDQLSGWWFHLNAIDIDNDGDQDLILGNKGENFYLKPNADQPVKLWIADLMEDGTFETVMTQYKNGKDRPVASKRDLTDQFADLKKQNLKHSDYAGKSVQELFDNEILRKGGVKEVNFPSSIVAINEGDGVFTINKLPIEVQFSTLNASEVIDLDKDGFNDLIIGGNNYGYLPQFSRLDGSYGLVLMNDKKGNFKVVNRSDSGFFVKGEVRDIKLLRIGDEQLLIVAINNEKPAVFLLNSTNDFQ